MPVIWGCRPKEYIHKKNPNSQTLSTLKFSSQPSTSLSMIGVMASTFISVANKPISNKRKKIQRTTGICKACSEEQREHIITMFLIFHLQPTKHLQYFSGNVEQVLDKRNYNIFQNSHQYQIAICYIKESIQTKENITIISKFCSYSKSDGTHSHVPNP